MLRKPEEGKNFTGNDQYIGYCVDLTKKIAEMLNFDYEIRAVHDRKFGAQGISLKLVVCSWASEILLNFYLFQIVRVDGTVWLVN